MHEPAAGGVSGEIVEEPDQKSPILRQDRSDDDAPAIGQVHHVNQLSRVAIPRSHCIKSPMPCWQTQVRLVAATLPPSCLGDSAPFTHPVLASKFVTLAKQSDHR